MHVCSHCRLLFAEPQAVCPHDGAATEAIEAPQVPESLAAKLSDFEPFASGQTGVSFLATQTSSGYRGLLKVIPFATLDSSERVRVKRELRKQSRLTHEGLPRIIDGGETANELWLFREFVQGESVAQRIHRLGKLDPQEAFAITAQAASCLDELQRNGLLHRDVKPSHIVLEPRPPSPIPVARLVDAGIASRLSTGSIFDLLGTPAYISPEQVMGKLVSFRSDLYALGCVMFEMLTGAPPFPSDDVRAVLEAHKSGKPPALPSELPPAVDALLASMLAKEPRQRPFSAQQVRRTLEPLLPEGTPLPAPGTRAPLGTPLPRTPIPAALPPLPNTNQARDAGPTTDELVLDDMPLSLPSSRNTMRIRDDELGDLEVLGSLAPGPQTEMLGDHDLRDLAVDSGIIAGPKTFMLSDKELGDLEVDGSLPPGPKTMMLSDRELRDLEVGNSLPGLPTISEPFASSRPPEASSRAPLDAPASPAIDVAAAEASAGAGTESAVASSPAQAPAPTAAPAPDAPGLTALHETAPTQIFRPRDSDSAPTRAAAPAVSAPLAAQPVAARPAPAAPAGVASRPPARKRIPGPAIAAAAATALMLVLIAVFAGQRDAPANPSAAVPPSSSTATTDRRPVSQAEPPVPVAPALARKPAASPPGETQPTAIVNGDRPAPADSPAEPPYVPELPPEDEPAQPPPAETSGSATATPENNRQSAARRAAAQAATYKAQGRAHYQAGRYRQAATAYQKAVGQNRNDAGAFAGLAASHLAGGEVDAAIAGYARAVRLQPSSSGFHAALGRAYLQKGDRQRARTEYERALELDRSNQAAQTALSQLK